MEEENKKEIERQSRCIKEGAILVSSWGYEQTNVSFYKVIRRKGKTVFLQELQKNIKYHKQDSGTCTPTNVLIGKPFRRRITKYASINIDDFARAKIYEGGDIYWSSYY